MHDLDAVFSTLGRQPSRAPRSLPAPHTDAAPTPLVTMIDEALLSLNGSPVTVKRPPAIMRELIDASAPETQPASVPLQLAAAVAHPVSRPVALRPSPAPLLLTTRKVEPLVYVRAEPLPAPAPLPQYVSQSFAPVPFMEVARPSANETVMSDHRRAVAMAAALNASSRAKSQATAWIAVSFAVLIAAALFCAGAFALRNAQATAARNGGPVASSPLRVTARALSTTPSTLTTLPQVDAAPSVPRTSNDGIPTLQVDALPKVINKYGVLHVNGAQYEGHRIFVDGAVVGSGAGDYEVYCGRHAVRVGSASRGHVVVIPCGGDANL